jgi:hypothetical protein
MMRGFVRLFGLGYTLFFLGMISFMIELFRIGKRGTKGVVGRLRYQFEQCISSLVARWFC